MKALRSHARPKCLPLGAKYDWEPTKLPRKGEPLAQKIQVKSSFSIGGLGGGTGGHWGNNANPVQRKEEKGYSDVSRIPLIRSVKGRAISSITPNWIGKYVCMGLRAAARATNRGGGYAPNASDKTY